MGILLFVAVVVCVCLVLAAMRKAPGMADGRPKRVLSFTTAKVPSEVARSIVRFAQSSGYQIEEMSPLGERIVASELPTLTTWGFFYPIHVTARSDGNTLVKVGITSRLVQYGPLTDRAHERFVSGIKAAIYAEGAMAHAPEPGGNTFGNAEERAITQGVAPTPGGRYCTSCGTPARSEDRFCAGCGCGLS